MVDMIRSPKASSIGTDYSDFLYATVGDNADSISILSAMARMNLDPWQEAGILADLPHKEAVGRLSALLAAIPGMPLLDLPELAAVRLIKLLPQRSHIHVPENSRVRLLFDQLKSSAATRGTSPPNGAARARLQLHVILALIALVLAAEWFVMSKPHRAAPSDTLATSTQPASTH